jgi:geranylgeranyl diphosphate synthase type II
LTLFNKTATEVMEGQQMDMNFEHRKDVSIEEYLKMIEYKTSVLLAASLQIGAMLGDASPKDQELMYEFGLKLGLAFQIKDDYLDAYGDERVGKVKGGDILQNKKTYLAITARTHASAEQIALLDQLLIETNPDKKVNQTLEIFNALNVPNKTHEFMEKLKNEAIQALYQCNMQPEKRNNLIQLAELIYNRDY